MISILLILFIISCLYSFKCVGSTVVADGTDLVDGTGGVDGNGAADGTRVVDETDRVPEDEFDEDDSLTILDVMVECFESNMMERTSPRDLSTIVYINDQNDPAISIDNWIDEIDAYNLIQLGNCVKKLAPENYEYRPFDLKGYGGGNNVTYLNEIAQAVYPEVLEQILDIAATVIDQVNLYFWF